MTRHAIGTLVLIDDGEIDDVALLRRETRFLGNAPERAVGFERRRALGEDAVQVGHEAPSLLDAVQDLGRRRWCGGSLVKRKSIDHLSSPFLNTERCGRTITHSPTLRQTRPGDMIHSGGEWKLLWANALPIPLSGGDCV